MRCVMTPRPDSPTKARLNSLGELGLDVIKVTYCMLLSLLNESILYQLTEEVYVTATTSNFVQITAKCA